MSPAHAPRRMRIQGKAFVGARVCARVFVLARACVVCVINREHGAQNLLEHVHFHTQLQAVYHQHSYIHTYICA